MLYKDMREFINKLDDEGELLRIKELVDWDTELGAVARRCLDLETKGEKVGALLFESIKDYPGKRFFTNTFGGCWRRIALALEMPKDTTIKALILEYVKRIGKPVKPITVATGPCKENIDVGEEVNLLKFPVPKWHVRDGGRYIGTWHICIMKDPDSGWVNWGTYRMMIHDEKTTGILISPDKHSQLIYSKYVERGEDMPMAVAIGADPVCNIVAAAGFPAYVSEVDYAGALRGAPVELVKAETIDIEVPASAEIILEGEVSVKERKMEGPFGEYTGYYGGDESPQPVFHVKCVTYRDGAILTGSMEGVPLVDDHIVGSLNTSALATYQLTKLSPVPGVQLVYSVPFGASWHFLIVSSKGLSPGQAHSVASALWGSRVGQEAGYVVVVDDDIDPTDLNQVIWAITTRAEPARAVHVYQRTRAFSPLVPNRPIPERVTELKPASAALIDAQFPPEWRIAHPEWVTPVCKWEDWPEETRNKATQILSKTFKKVERP